DLYFGKTPDPALLREDFSSTTHTKSALENSTKYYWKVVANDGTHEVEEPVWSSTTRAFCLVQESFESLTLGPLSSSTLSWGDYQKASTLFAEITQRGFDGTKGLTFVDPTVFGYAKVVARDSSQRNQVQSSLISGFQKMVSSVSETPYVALHMSMLETLVTVLAYIRTIIRQTK
ncbi:MAG TPA: hypothetical protein DCY45_01140, partial [Mesotoga sp.]|nr:hypothetical protein [Mesotoga sp.]